MKFLARERFAFSNGAVGWRPGGPFDCLGPYAKVENCPLVRLEWFPYPGREEHEPGAIGCGQWASVDTGLRLTCYATGYADSFFSVPACTRFRGQHVGGYFTSPESGSDAVVFMVSGKYRERLPHGPDPRPDFVWWPKE